MNFPEPVLAHFQVADSRLYEGITQHGLQCRAIEPVVSADQFFTELCESIVSQQLAVSAADAIWARMLALFPKAQITPERLLQIPEQQLRDVGLSWGKVRYVRDLAAQTAAGTINYASIGELSDEAVITELTKVKGIGRWTAEMFLMFTLGRPDVFSFGDLGLVRGFQKLYAVPDEMIARRLLPEVTAAWAPYRSFGAFALWAYYDKTK